MNQPMTQSDPFQLLISGMKNQGRPQKFFSPAGWQMEIERPRAFNAVVVGQSFNKFVL
jgi:hypothetical protein